MMDIKNTPLQHTIVGLFAMSLVTIFYYFLDVSWAASFARVALILLFIVMAIGPTIALSKYKTGPSPLLTPHAWRGELGIWFVLMSLMHVVVLLNERAISSFIKIGGSGYALANLMGLVALIIGLILAATSFNKVILAIGVPSWQWVHKFAYVLFYLAFAHMSYFQFFSTYGGHSGPDWFGYMTLFMFATVILLQIAAFIKVTIRSKKLSLQNNTK